jgi:hypothetical protein
MPVVRSCVELLPQSGPTASSSVGIGAIQVAKMLDARVLFVAPTNGHPSVGVRQKP